MDFAGIPRGTIRAEALKRLAKLSVEQASSNLRESVVDGDVDEFYTLLSYANKDEVTHDLSDVAITPKEYEVLIALCEATTCKLKSDSQAEALLFKLRLYLLELPNQKFSNHIVEKTFVASPWTILGEKVTAALVNLSQKFERRFYDAVLDIFHEFTSSFFTEKSFELSNYFTLLGYIQGLNNNAEILCVSPKSFNLFRTLDTCVDNFEFLTDIENYTNNLYSQANGSEYSGLLDRDFVSELSPVLFLERISKLMYSIINVIIENKDKPLLECILSRVSSEEAYVVARESLELSLHDMDIIKTLSTIAIQKMEFLDRGETYIVYSTYNRLRLGYLAKSYNLQVISYGMFTDNVDVKTSKHLFRNCLEIKDVMLDPDLGLSVLQLGSLLVFKDEEIGASLTRAFTSLVANPRFNSDYCTEASKSVGLATKVLSQDAVVTTTYALTNLLFVGNDGLQLQTGGFTRRSTGRDNISLRDLHSPISRRASVNSMSNGNAGNKSVSADFDEQDYRRVCENAITAIIEISKACDDETVISLAVTLLSQKIPKLDSPIGDLLLKGLVSCAPYLPEREFITLLKLLHKLSMDSYEGNKPKLLQSLIHYRVELSHKLKPTNPLFKVYLHEILQAILSKGDNQDIEHHRSHDEIGAVGNQIGLYLKPLAELLPDVKEGEEPLEIKDSDTINLMRNIWFNMVVHGYSVKSPIVKTYSRELERIAYNTPPLASELSWDRTETSLELNSILRRRSSNHNVKDLRNILGDIFEVHRTLSYSKLMFLSATIFIETLRVRSGDCSTILQYFSDPSIQSSELEKYIGSISFKIGKDYIYLINCGANKQFSAQHTAEQLTKMLALCCHRVEDLQDAALQCCDLLINKVPSSLVHHKSLFAMFDLLTLLFDSLVDAEEHQYEPTTSYRAKRTGIHLSLSDSYKWRTETFTRFQEKAKHWVKLILLKCSIDVKSLIQSYVSDMDRFQSSQKIQYGVSFALEMSGSVLASDRELSNVTKYSATPLNTLPIIVSQLSWRSNFVSELMDKVPLHTQEDSDKAFKSLRVKVVQTKENLKDKTYHPVDEDIIDLLSEIAGFSLISEENSGELIRYLVQIPFQIFAASIMNAAIGIWFAVMKDRPNLSMILLAEIAKQWEISIELKKGLFSKNHDLINPEFMKMEYSPSDRKSVNKLAHYASKSFEPHSQIIKLFSSNFEATLNQSDHLLKLFTRFVEVGLKNLHVASFHPFSRFVRFELIRFSFDVLNYHNKLGSRSVVYLTGLILDASLSWFKQRANYPFGSNNLKIKADYGLIKDVAKLMSHLSTYKLDHLESKKIILMFFLDDEIAKMGVWLNPIKPVDTKGNYISNQISGNHIIKSYSYDPILAINLALRYKVKNLDELLQTLLLKNPLPAIFYPEAVQFFIGISGGTSMPGHQLLFWEPLAPVDAITLFLPPFSGNLLHQGVPYLLQYTMRSLEYHDINLTFFYVPQIVQSLRFDSRGYVERFILETARVSQLFAHQIIWNMLANSYKDEDSTEPDSMKPVLDRIQGKITQGFSEDDLSFYQKEFEFFNEVTDISGKLKPYIKKTKAEKKVKIDEEMHKIAVKPGVYLPVNPDGVVIDINRNSGKPLQSHAKAPFMASFRIKKEIKDVDEYGKIIMVPIERWQSCIFKVGDDCRQDVLALQLISVFRSIWTAAGLDLYVYPNRVVATAPGCGVIEVLPNSVSRDMLGREAVNGLYEYFTTKFGPENSIEFQQARNNLIKSLAAYSIISFLLQFKDRHNGNIMYDDQGHILHIDFGFCFDIVPGGVKFEVSPFKLTHEMVMVLGGSSDTQAFKWFEELCVKGFLACRPYMETIVRCVTPMLESGLPCFKEATIKNLRARFVPNKSEKDASAYMRGLVKKSLESYSTKVYDEFQKITNGIPY